MTKVYLVCERDCISSGTIDMKSNERVVKAFTNRRLADKCINYLNEEWRKGFNRNANFATEKIRYYFRKTMVIEHDDYSKIPF